MTNIYLICAEIEGERLHKIGFTKRDVNIRLKEFKTGNAADLYLVDSFKSKWGTTIEASLHRNFKAKKISGEWFKLDDKDIKTFKERCQSMHDNLTYIESNNLYYQEKIINNMSSLKEMAIREYISKIDFKNDDWKIPKLKEDLRLFLGEEPGIDIIYKKDVMINEFSGEAKEFMDVDKVQVIFTDTDEKFKKIEFLINGTV